MALHPDYYSLTASSCVIAGVLLVALSRTPRGAIAELVSRAYLWTLLVAGPAAFVLLVKRGDDFLAQHRPPVRYVWDEGYLGRALMEWGSATLVAASFCWGLYLLARVIRWRTVLLVLETIYISLPLAGLWLLGAYAFLAGPLSLSPAQILLFLVLLAACGVALLCTAALTFRFFVRGGLVPFWPPPPLWQGAFAGLAVGAFGVSVWVMQAADPYAVERHVGGFHVFGYALLLAAPLLTLMSTRRSAAGAPAGR